LILKRVCDTLHFEYGIHYSLVTQAVDANVLSYNPHSRLTVPQAYCLRCVNQHRKLNDKI